MRKPKVSVYLRIRLQDGQDKFAEPARNRNRTLREGYAVVGAKAEHHPEGIYYLRYAFTGKKRVWDTITQVQVGCIAVSSSDYVNVTGQCSAMVDSCR